MAESGFLGEDRFLKPVGAPKALIKVLVGSRPTAEPRLPYDIVL